MNEDQRKEQQRNRKREQRKKTKRIDLVVSPEQFDYLKGNAEARGYQHLSVFVRHIALAYLGQVFVVPDTSSEKMRFFTRQLKGIATNINQLTRYIHSSEEKALSGHLLQEMQSDIRSIENYLIDAFEMPPNLWDEFCDHLEDFPKPFLEKVYETVSKVLQKDRSHA